MTYLFSNPQVKKWKTLFLLSFVLNMVFLIIIFVGDKKEQPKTEPANNTDTIANVQNKDIVVPVNENVKNIQPEKKKIPEGEQIIISVSVENSFFEAFNSNEEISALSDESGIPNLPELLSAHIGRLLIWDLVIRSDVRNGDRIDFIFRIVPAEEKKIRKDMPDSIEIVFLAYHSKKFGKNIRIFRFKKDDAEFAKYYYADASAIEKNIVPNPPIKNYIQITSVVGDRSSKHGGVDFKALVGTPVYSTVDGSVVRKNWMTKYNGYCVEVRDKDKSNVFKYLHLSGVNVVEGQKVKSGEQIGVSGNTGKTTAPHLHYQINSVSKNAIVNPFKYHKTSPEVLKGNDLERFNSFVTEVEAAFDKNL